MISTLATQYPVRSLCRVLEVTRSGYYQWRGKVAGPRAQANQQLLEQIRLVFDQSRQTYGSPRVTRQLRRQQIACSEKRVARLMRRHNIRVKSKCPFRPRTTDSQHYLYQDGRELGLSGRGDGSLQPQDRRLVLGIHFTNLFGERSPRASFGYAPACRRPPPPF